MDMRRGTSAKSELVNNLPGTYRVTAVRKKKPLPGRVLVLRAGRAGIDSRPGGTFYGTCSLGGLEGEWRADVHADGYNGTATIDRLTIRLTDPPPGIPKQHTFRGAEVSPVTQVTAYLHKWRTAAFAIDALYTAHAASIGRLTATTTPEGELLDEEPPDQ